MATTTNYSWTTPDDTALVKDGAAAIRTLGSSADTTVKALNPGTTAGDVDYYTTSTTKARLGIGTAGQVLTVNSGATAPEWATVAVNRLTLLSTTTLSGATTTISSIPGTYTDLYAIFYGVTGTQNARPRIAPNGTTTIANQINFDQTSLQAENGTYISPGFATISSNANNSFFLTIFNYASTSTYKGFQLCGGTDAAGALCSGVIETTSAITSLVFSRDSGNQSAGTVLLYGVK